MRRHPFSPKKYMGSRDHEFHESFQANPYDAAQVLAYADYVEEQGKTAHAEMIRRHVHNHLDTISHPDWSERTQMNDFHHRMVELHPNHASRNHSMYRLAIVSDTEDNPYAQDLISVSFPLEGTPHLLFAQDWIPTHQSNDLVRRLAEEGATLAPPMTDIHRRSLERWHQRGYAAPSGPTHDFPRPEEAEEYQRRYGRVTTQDIDSFLGRMQGNITPHNSNELIFADRLFDYDDPREQIVRGDMAHREHPYGYYGGLEAHRKTLTPSGRYEGPLHYRLSDDTHISIDHRDRNDGAGPFYNVIWDGGERWPFEYMTAMTGDDTNAIIEKIKQEVGLKDQPQQFRRSRRYGRAPMNEIRTLSDAGFNSGPYDPRNTEDKILADFLADHEDPREEIVRRDLQYRQAHIPDENELDPHMGAASNSFREAMVEHARHLSGESLLPSVHFESSQRFRLGDGTEIHVTPYIRSTRRTGEVVPSQRAYRVRWSLPNNTYLAAFHASEIPRILREFGHEWEPPQDLNLEEEPRPMRRIPYARAQRVHLTLKGAPYVFTKNDQGWGVVAASSPTDRFHRSYQVTCDENGNPVKCSCPDNFYRGGVCKHMQGVQQINTSSPQENTSEEEPEQMSRDNPVKGGIGDRLSPSEVKTSQLQEGRRVEMEHTSSPRIAEDIALDHLKENPNYYTDLRKVERTRGRRRMGRAHSVHLFDDRDKPEREDISHPMADRDGQLADYLSDFDDPREMIVRRDMQYRAQAMDEEPSERAYGFGVSGGFWSRFWRHRDDHGIQYDPDKEYRTLSREVHHRLRDNTYLSVQPMGNYRSDTPLWYRVEWNPGWLTYASAMSADEYNHLVHSLEMHPDELRPTDMPWRDGEIGGPPDSWRQPTPDDEFLPPEENFPPQEYRRRREVKKYALGPEHHGEVSGFHHVMEHELNDLSHQVIYADYLEEHGMPMHAQIAREDAEASMNEKDPPYMPGTYNSVGPSWWVRLPGGRELQPGEFHSILESTPEGLTEHGLFQRSLTNPSRGFWWRTFLTPEEALRRHHQLAEEGAHTTPPLDELPGLYPRRYAAYRAPAGGMVVRGTAYKGGEMIPDMEGDFVNPPDKPVKMAEEEKKPRRRRKRWISERTRRMLNVKHVGNALPTPPTSTC